jgi:hypothetical protein
LGVAGLAASGDDGDRASLLLGSAANLLDTMGADFKPFERHLHDLTDARARRLCGDEGFEATRLASAALSLDQAVEVALGAVTG